MKMIMLLQLQEEKHLQVFCCYLISLYTLLFIY